MAHLLPRLVPVLALGVTLGAFMAVDRLWLHWYTPDAGRFLRERQAISASPTGPARSLTLPSPRITEAEARTSASSESSRNAFAALWLVAQRTPYRARYETLSPSGDRGDSYVVFNSPPLGRVDTITAGATALTSQLFVDADGVTTRCGPVAGRRQCVPSEPLAGPIPLAAGPVVFPRAETFDSYDVTELDRRILADSMARCFHLASTGIGAEETADYCFSYGDAVVPVYGRGTFGVAEAFQVSSSVSEADFVALGVPPDGSGQGIAFSSVVGDTAGGTASVSVQTAPGAFCTIEYITPAGTPSSDQGLAGKLADARGAVSWSWRISARSRPGTGTVAVACGGEHASADILIG